MVHCPLTSHIVSPRTFPTDDKHMQSIGLTGEPAAATFSAALCVVMEGWGGGECVCGGVHVLCVCCGWVGVSV